MSANAADLDDISFNMESVDEIVGEIEENELICENVDSGVNVSHPVDEEKKKDFERNQDDILSRVPDKVKARFGGIYFTTFGKFTGPVLVMNPYSVAPGSLRENWLTMFHNCQKSGREMTHMAYWYGCSNDLLNAYSFPKTSQLMSYEIGFKKMEKKLNGLRQKLDGGKKLSGKDANLLNGMEEVEIDRKKNSGERSGVVGFDFLEDYHVLVEEQEQDEPQKKKPIKDKPGKSKKKKMKKKKILTQPDNQIMMTKTETQEFVGNGEGLKTKKVIKKRSKKDKNSTDPSRPKKKVKTSEESYQYTKPVVKSTTANLKDNDIRHKESGDERVSDKHGTATVEDARPSAYEEFAGLDEVSSHGETDDENLLMNDLESEDDSADEDYIKHEKSKMKKKKQRTEENPVTSKKQAKKKTAKVKSETENSVKGEKKSANKTSSNNRVKKEQERFRSCENKFLHLVRRWEIAIDNKDTNQLSRIYEQLLENMEHFTAPFIEVYGMSDLMKKSKKFVEDKDKWKQVMARFKKVYTEKRDAVPEGFKAIKESEMKASNDEKIELTMEVSKHTESLALQLELEGDTQNSNQVIKIENKLDIQHKPMEKIPKSIKKSRVCVSGRDIKTPLKLEPSSQKKHLSTAKTEKKKRFSLTKLMRPVSSSYPGLGGEDLPSSSGGESTAIRLQSSKLNQMVPSWTSQAMSTETPQNENRLFGLEFLQQATPCIPENKNVNHNAIAHNLELAIYDWSTGDFNKRKNLHGIGKNNNHENESEELWVDKYWSKIHDLVACISGKRLKGTVAGMIAVGKFASPDKLICLSDDDLLCSFLSSPLPGF